MNNHPQLALPRQTHVVERPANIRLSLFALGVLIANVLAATLAVAVNWPSQFGGVVGTDAGQDWLSRGTAISAPLAPVMCFVLIAILVRFDNWVGWLGIGLAFLTGVLVFLGGMGEFIAEPTELAPRGVLTMAGVLWGVIAAVFVVLAIAATRERRAHRDAT
jgi:drug/metabolite transporter (DMT)-like permease